MSVKQEIISKQIAGLGTSNSCGNRSEISLLHQILNPDEKILTMATGELDAHYRLIVITDKRICIVCSSTGDIDLEITDIFLSKIKSIQHIKSDTESEIQIFVGEKSLTIRALPISEAQKVLAAINRLGTNTTKMLNDKEIQDYSSLIPDEIKVQISRLKESDRKILNKRQETKLLHKILDPDEVIFLATNVFYESHQVPFLVTDKRILLISGNEKEINNIVITFPAIISVTPKEGVITGQIKFSTVKKEYLVTGISSDEVNRIAATISSVRDGSLTKERFLSTKRNFVDVDKEIAEAKVAKISKPWLIAIIVIICILIVGNLGQDKLIRYNILNEEIYPTNWRQGIKPYKKGYVVEVYKIGDRYPTEKELEAVFNKIKKSNPRVNFTYVDFYLPGMEIGNVHWAGGRCWEDEGRQYIDIIGVNSEEYMLNLEMLIREDIIGKSEDNDHDKAK